MIPVFTLNILRNKKHIYICRKKAQMTRVQSTNLTPSLFSIYSRLGYFCFCNHWGFASNRLNQKLQSAILYRFFSFYFWPFCIYHNNSPAAFYNLVKSLSLKNRTYRGRKVILDTEQEVGISDSRGNTDTTRGGNLNIGIVGTGSGTDNSIF